MADTIEKQTSEKKKQRKPSQVKNPLKNERILVKPVIWTSKNFGKQHSANWQFDNTGLLITVKADPNTGMLKEPLSKDEREFFEDPSRHNEHRLTFGKGDLSVRKKEDNYWEEYEYRLRKQSDGSLDEEEILDELDLSKADDYFKYKVLLTNSGPKGIVAEGWGNRYSRGTNKLVLVSEGAKHVDALNKANKMKEVNKFFYSIDNSSEKLFDFLNVFYLENKDYNQPPSDAGHDWYVAEMQKLVDKRPDDILKIIKNEDDYQMKILVHRAIKNGILTFNGRTGIDDTATGKPLGSDISDVIKFLQQDKNQSYLLKIKGVLNKDKE